MPPTPATDLLGRFLDVVFGKKLEGNDAERALAARPPQWAFTVYAVLFWALLLVVIAIPALGWGWIPFMDSRIDSIWAAAALGANILLSEAWRWLTRRYERRAKACVPSQTTFPE